MHWGNLFTDFSNGKPEAVQAVLSIVTILIGAIGTIYVAITFKRQTKINRQQFELNRLAAEKHRREIRPVFTVSGRVDNEKGICHFTLTNAIALNVEFWYYDESNKLKSKPDSKIDICPLDYEFPNRFWG